ncbi:hypothetical protein [Natrarchaeobius oligotrophus]|uniref:DUF8159 domain-containing protein n=1 Tax=Natrarchaeobius chitinivorans TaxID=1679083 RepID=A0A3N6PS25_NATCH|nr:hypothetical protein [Natrarchaeobius chitinivorans]RQH02266.1 hypothetical protein EA472_02900 [Natrarchaeobius chitinivorans]
MAVGSTIVLAGCTGENNQRAANEDDGSRGANRGDERGEDNEQGASADDDALEFFRSHLDDVDVSVVTLETAERTVELVYATEAATDQQLADEIGTIAGGYILARDHGLETDRLESTVTDGSDPLATWYVRSTWAEEFEAGEITPEAFSANVLNSVELADSESE